MKSEGTILVLFLVLLISIGPSIEAKTLFSDDFSKGADRWDIGAGKWEVKNDQYVQTTTDAFLSSFVKLEHWDPKLTQYTLELKAMKLDGKEGWDIVFGISSDSKVPAVKGDRNSMTFYDWNIAGWGNTRSVLRKRVKGKNSNVVDTTVSKTVGNNKWYKIKIEVSPRKTVGFIDGKKGFEVKEGPENGRIGFSLFGTSGAFDDVIVYDSDGPNAVSRSLKLTTHWSQIKKPSTN